jgi:hypothetical protein
MTDEVTDNYEEWAKTWVVIVLIVNVVFFVASCKKTQILMRNLKKRKRVTDYIQKWRKELLKYPALQLFKTLCRPSIALGEVLQQVPWTMSSIVGLWCIVEILLPKQFQV